MFMVQLRSVGSTEHNVMFIVSVVAKRGVQGGTKYNWGEPERAPHSRDLHHFFTSYVRLSV